MLIERRASGRSSAHFPLGAAVVARPATVGRPIVGTVVGIVGTFTITVLAGDLEIVVDTEDCADPSSVGPT